MRRTSPTLLVLVHSSSSAGVRFVLLLLLCNIITLYYHYCLQIHKEFPGSCSAIADNDTPRHATHRRGNGKFDGIVRKRYYAQKSNIQFLLCSRLKLLCLHPTPFSFTKAFFLQFFFSFRVPLSLGFQRWQKRKSETTMYSEDIARCHNTLSATHYASNT